MRIALVTSLFLSLIACSAANAAGWIVDRLGGRVTYTTDGRTWSDIQVGQEVPATGWIKTGSTGRVILSRGEERIMFKSDTLASILTWQENGENTKVVQRSGSILLDIEIRDRRHAKVVTPHLAAVVKGTVFEVTTNQRSSEVRVDRGRVDVRDGDTNREISITAGQKAEVSAQPGAGMTISRAAPPRETIAAVAASLPAVPGTSPRASQTSPVRSPASSTRSERNADDNGDNDRAAGTNRGGERVTDADTGRSGGDETDRGDDGKGGKTDRSDSDRDGDAGNDGIKGGGPKKTAPDKKGVEDEDKILNLGTGAGPKADKTKPSDKDKKKEKDKTDGKEKDQGPDKSKDKGKDNDKSGSSKDENDEGSKKDGDKEKDQDKNPGKGKGKESGKGEKGKEQEGGKNEDKDNEPDEDKNTDENKGDKGRDSKETKDGNGNDGSKDKGEGKSKDKK